ncbi:MAG: transposase [Cyclobacteriaceae bacterium]
MLRDTHNAHHLKRRKKTKNFRRRAAIEPVIGHLKPEFRMAQNYLHGEQSPKMNALLAATALNMKKMMQQLKVKMLWLYIEIKCLNIYSSPRKMNVSS